MRGRGGWVELKEQTNLNTSLCQFVANFLLGTTTNWINHLIRHMSSNQSLCKIDLHIQT
jgi:hypothetical protein